jgi:hypothetical protein
MSMLSGVTHPTSSHQITSSIQFESGYEGSPISPASAASRASGGSRGSRLGMVQSLDARVEICLNMLKTFLAS